MTYLSVNISVSVLLSPVSKSIAWSFLLSSLLSKSDIFFNLSTYLYLPLSI